ncbi:hypothetical protein CF098_07855 [Clostridium sporogenes]
MKNPFEHMKDEEFLYQMCAFMGKDNFIRFATLIGSNCPKGGCTTGMDNCGECFYKFLGEYEKNNKIE